MVNEPTNRPVINYNQPILHQINPIHSLHRSVNPVLNQVSSILVGQKLGINPTLDFNYLSTYVPLKLLENIGRISLGFVRMFLEYIKNLICHLIEEADLRILDFSVIFLILFN